MATRPLRCPSCGGALPAVGTPCPTCGFTVWRADGGWDDQVFRSARGPVAAVAVGWAPTAPSPPRRIVAPAPVDPPSSPASSGGISMIVPDSAPDRFLAASLDRAPDGLAADATDDLPDGAPAIPARPRGAAPGGVRAAKLPAPAAPWSASSMSRAAYGRRATPVRYGEAAARALERRRELAAAVGRPAPPPASAGGRSSPPPNTTPGSSAPPVSTTAGFSAPLMSTTAGRSGPPMSMTAMRAAAAGVAPLGNEPSWWHESADAADSTSRRPRRRASSRSRRRGLVVLVMVLLIAGRAAYSNYADRAQPGSPPTQTGLTVTMPTPDTAALHAVRHELSALSGIESPAGHVHGSPATAAAKAQRLRVALVLWRGAHTLDAHQLAVLGHAIAYAGALRRSLAAPQDVARRRAAVRVLRAWLSDDPTMAQ